MKSDKTIAEKIEQLQQKMDWFQGDEFSLDVAAERYQEVEQLAADIESTLLEMQNEVELIREKFDA